MTGRGTWTLPCLALLVLAPGCGGARFGNVSGTVTYQGKPVADGTITFFDAANGAVSSPIADDGSYTVGKVPVGLSRIAVVTPVAIPFPGMDGGKGARPGKPPGATTAAPVPAKYGDPEKSGLTYEVQPGGQKHDVALD